MDNSNPVASLAILLVAALIGGMIAHRLRQPIILGYLVIGAAIGPHALGWVSDRGLVETMATIGVALLMFTLGLEVSVTQLRQVGRVGLWGGVAQIGLTAAIGVAVGKLRLRLDAGPVGRVRHGYLPEQHHGLPEDTHGPR